MEQCHDFDFSCSPTVSYPAMHMQSSTTAVKRQELFGINLTNFFQNDAIALEHRLLIDTPVSITLPITGTPF